jgi:hypothetical protein
VKKTRDNPRDKIELGNETLQKGVSLMKKHIFEDIILQNALNFTKEVVESPCKDLVGKNFYN